MSAPPSAAAAAAAAAASGAAAPSPSSSSSSPASPSSSDPSSPARLAYLTMVTSDSFVVGAQVLSYSLRRVGASYPLFVLCTPNLTASSERALAHAGWTVLRVQPLSHGRSTAGHVSAWDEVGYTKLRAWQLTQFTRVLYIDADCLVHRNVDHLLRDVPLSISLAAAPDVFPPDRLNAGVMLLKPDRHVFDAMIQHMSHARSYDGGDTGFLNTFFDGWFQSASCIEDSSRMRIDPSLSTHARAALPHSSVSHALRAYRGGVARLGFGYNALRILQWFTKKAPAYWSEGVQPSLHIVHYCSSPKPWEDLHERRGGFLEQQYFDAHAATQVELAQRTLPHGCDVPLTFEVNTEGGAVHLSDDVRAHASHLTPFQSLQAYLALHLDQTPFGEFTLEEGPQPQPTGAVRPIRRGVWMNEEQEDQFLAHSRAMLRTCLMAGASSLPCSTSPTARDAPSSVASTAPSAAVNARGIPRLIHQVWLGGAVPDEYSAWRASWLQHHPSAEGWQYRLWCDADFASFPLCGSLSDAASCFLASHLTSLLARCGSVAQRSDLFRLDILWTHGGLYVDTDFECLATMTPMHAGGCWGHALDAYAGFSNSGAVELNNGLMAARPHHPFIGKLIQSVELPHLPPSPLSSHACEVTSPSASALSSSASSLRVSAAVPSAMEVIELTGPGHFTRTAARFLEENAQRARMQQQEVAAYHALHVSRVVLLPAQCFFPLPNSMRHLQRAEDKRAFFTPISFAVHHWACSWQKKTKNEQKTQSTVQHQQTGAASSPAASAEAPSDTASILALVQRLQAMKRNDRS